MTQNHTLHRVYSLLFAILIFGACKQGPNEATIQLEEDRPFSKMHANIRLDVHRVVIQKVQPAEKYLYLQVQEGDQTYWMATGLREVNPGEVYRYNEALVKTNFESKELGRVFDTLYLVTRVVPETQAKKMGPADLSRAISNPHDPKGIEEGSPSAPESSRPVEISKLLADAGQHQGQWIEITGNCVKVNNDIMNRNWVHLATDDGSAQVVVTTQAEVQKGEQVTFVAQVALDRDFGSGYSYPVLLEKGQRLD